MEMRKEVKRGENMEETTLRYEPCISTFFLLP